MLDGGVIPFVEVSLTSRGDTKSGLAMFDTGAYTTILNSQDVPIPYRVMGEWGKMVGSNRNRYTPKLKLGDQEFSGFNYNVQDIGKDGLHMILGIDLLKRFNTILDNRNGYLYLEPNSRMRAPYGRRGEYYLVMIATGLLLPLTGMVAYWKIRRKRKNESV